MQEITSVSNKTYKHIKSLLTKKARQEHMQYSVEGIKSVCEAIDSPLTEVDSVSISRSFAEKNREIVSDIEKKCDKIYCFPDSYFEALSDTKTPSGILAVINKKNPEIDIKDGLYVYCDCIQDPGNAGTIIRTADAAGANGVIFSKFSADIYSPKVIRSTMGSFFHIPVYDEADCEILNTFKEKGFSVYGGALTETCIDYREADYNKNSVIIVGNESNGISKTVLDMCDKAVKIPIHGGAESLNASVAASILVYEWARKHK